MLGQFSSRLVPLVHRAYVGLSSVSGGTYSASVVEPFRRRLSLLGVTLGADLRLWSQTVRRSYHTPPPSMTMERLNPRTFTQQPDVNVERSDVLTGQPRIMVVGVGGAGGNAVNNMIASSLQGVEFLVANTDAQALKMSLSPNRIQLGASLTEGLGAGARPDIGRAAAEEAYETLKREFRGAHLVFVTAGMGGGTGTGAAPIIARAAAELGCLTVAVVTKPFHFEGIVRTKIAEQGIHELSQQVDTILVIPNQNLFKVASPRTSFLDAFRLADHVLYSGVRSITDLMTVPGLINLDFADVRSVVKEMGRAMMGSGEVEMEAGNEERAIRASDAAICNPLLDETSLRGARGVLVNITGGVDMTLFEVDAAANRIREEVDPDANIIFGSTFDATMQGRLRVSVLATGIPSG
jgi:cell division protein FtsZ